MESWSNSRVGAPRCRKICIVFEGRDGAGKGGTIKALTARVSPRIFRVVALPAPTEREKSQMYIQRYLPHLPAGGEIVIFDRSWYNRAGVERVMGFCTGAGTPLPGCRSRCGEGDHGVGRHSAQVPARSEPDEQTRRLEDRIDDDRKIWKLSPMDIKSYTRRDDYSEARDEMFRRRTLPERLGTSRDPTTRGRHASTSSSTS